MRGYGTMFFLAFTINAVSALNDTVLYSKTTSAAGSSSSPLRLSRSSWVSTAPAHEQSHRMGSSIASAKTQSTHSTSSQSWPTSVQSAAPEANETTPALSMPLHPSANGTSAYASFSRTGHSIAIPHAFTAPGSDRLPFAQNATTTRGRGSNRPMEVLATGQLPSESLDMNFTRNDTVAAGRWQSALSCNAHWQAWSSEYVTTQTVTNVSETVSYTASYLDFVTPHNVTPYTTLCDGTPRAHGEASYSLFLNSGSYTQASITTMTLPHITTPSCSIPASECGRMWASYSLGDGGTTFRSAPACAETCDPKYHTTWINSVLPPCYVQADEVEVAYWPVQVDGDTCFGNQTTVTRTDTIIPTASTWGTSITSPGVLVSFRNIWAIDQCSSTIGSVLQGYILSQQTSQISTQCGAYHQGGSPGTQVNFADFNFPYAASAYKCQQQCGNGVGGMQNYCQTMYDNFNPQIAFPTDVFNIKPEWKSCKIEYLGNMINDPPKALTQAAAPAQPTAPTIVGPGPTTPATPHQPPPITTAKPTGGAQPTNGNSGSGGEPNSGDNQSPGENDGGSDEGGSDNHNGGSNGGSGGSAGSDSELGNDDVGSGGDHSGSGNDGSGGSASGSNTGSGGNNGGSNDEPPSGSNDEGSGGHEGSHGGRLTDENQEGSNGGGSKGSGSSEGASSGSGSNDPEDHGSNDGRTGGAGNGGNGLGSDQEAAQNIGGVIASILDPATRQLPAAAVQSLDAGRGHRETNEGEVGSTAVVQLDNKPITVIAVGDAGAIEVAGQTLGEGQAARISGHVVSNAGNSIVVDGTSAASIAQIAGVPAQLGALVGCPTQTLTALARDGTAVIDGETLKPGQTAVIHGQTVSDASTGLVVNGQTVAFSRLAGSLTSPVKDGVVFRVGSATLTAADSGGTAIFNRHTLTSGQTLTINGHSISDAGTALVVDGTRTIPFSHIAAQATPTPTAGAVFTIDGRVYTATNLPNGDVVVDGITLHRGGAAMTIDGMRISDGPNGLVIGDRTLAASAASLPSAPVDADGTTASKTSRAASKLLPWRVWTLGCCVLAVISLLL